MATLFRPREIDRLVAVAVQESDDAELLRRYCDTGDSEAFESIVRRHAGTVLGVCRRILRDPHAAEDAFQATFLQLVRKARSLRSPLALAAWLYATARRTALRHRRAVPPTLMTDPRAPSQNPLDQLTARELLAAIEDDIARLPAQYRLPLVLCYLDGLSKRQAAERLGLSAGVFRGLLDRGREKLRMALTRRGFAPASLLGLLIPATESASAELLTRTLGICTRGERMPAAIAFLAAGRSSLLMKAGLIVGLLLFGGLGLIAAASRAEAPQAKVEASQPANPQPRRDLYGDPLPPGAIARMGSIRWRHADENGSWLRVIPSPTGMLIATVIPREGGKTVGWVWDLTDGKQVCEFPWEDTLSGGDLQFTPDGSRLMFLGARGIVRFYDPRTGKIVAESKPVVEKDDIQTEFITHRYSSTAHMLTGDGGWVVTWDNGKLILSEITTDPAATQLQVKLELPTGNHFLRSGCYTCDTHTLAFSTLGRDNDTLRWDIRTGKFIGKTTLNSNNLMVASTRDGKRVATWRYDVPPYDVLRVWNTETGTKLVPLEGAERKGYGSIRFSPDGKRLIAGAARTETSITATVWELEHGKVIGRVTVPEWCTELFLLPDGKTILGANGVGMMFGTWDIATGRRLSPITGHESSVLHVAFAGDGKSLLTASGDHNERITAWDAATGKKLQELMAAHGSASFVIVPGGAVTTTERGTLIWTDPKTGRELRRVAPKQIPMEADDYLQKERVSLIHDPQTGKPAVLGVSSFGLPPFASGAGQWKEVLTLRDAESGELIGHRVYSRNCFGPAGVVSPDGRLLVRHFYDSENENSVVVDSAFGGRGTFRLKLQPDDLHPEFLFTPDGQTLIAVTRKYSPEKPGSPAAATDTVRLWEVRSGKPRLEFAVPALERDIGKWSPFDRKTIAISPDGRFIAGAESDTRTIHVWDLATGTEVAKRGGYRSAVDSLTFRPDGKALASGHVDGTALVWDLSGLPGVKPTATDRGAAWKNLASADAAKAYRAMLALAADSECVAFLHERVKPMSEPPAAQIQKLVKDLGDEDFATREAATKALKKLGDAATAELQKQLRGELSTEQQQRISEVLDSQTLIESDPERLRALRCIEVLERAGTTEARAVLGELVKGAAGTRLTREAAAALRRLESQSR